MKLPSRITTAVFAVCAALPASSQEPDMTSPAKNPSISAIASAVAEDETDYDDYLLGDLFGARSSLVQSGITPFLYYDSIFAGNVSGGLRTGEAFTGQVYAGVDLDLEKLIGWSGASMKISMVNRHGETANEYVGGVYDPMCIYGGQVSYLYQFFLEKTFGKQWSVKLGRLSADNDFLDNELYRYSLSTAINGPMRATLLENSITSFPYPVWGGRVKYNPSDEHQFQIGAYQTGDGQWDFTEHGADLSIRGDDGVSVLVQYDWTPQIFDRQARVFAGAINTFREFDNFDSAGTTDFLFRTYLHADVEIADGLRVFGFATYSDEEQVAKTPLQVSGGVNYQGMIPGRADDHSMFFVTYGQLSDAYGKSIGKDVDHEMVYELGHRIQLTPSCYVQPSIQYIQQPGGAGDIDDAIVIGAWIGIAF